MCIRAATADDLPDVLRLYAENEDSPEDVLSLAEATAIWQRYREYPNYRLFVASVDREIAGTFALLIMDNLAHRGAKSGVVEDVIVATQFQKRGIGKQMMHFAIDQCAQFGCYKLSLSSNAKRTQAHAFYEALGFARHGYSFSVPTKATHASQ